MNSGGIQAGEVRGGSHTVFPEEAGTQQGEAPGVKVPRVLNLEKESSEHFKWTHLEQVQHSTYLPRQVTFPVHTEQGKTALGLG